MHSELRIDDLTEAVMREVGKFGLAPAVNGQYQRAYRDFRAFAASRGFVSYSRAIALKSCEQHALAIV